MNTTVTITIGRNWGAGAREDAKGTPMSDAMWGHFQTNIDRLLVRAIATVFVARAIGHGGWDGVDEESATWVAGVDEADDVSFLSRELAQLARLYLQDAIALTVGQTELVEGYTS